MKQRRTTSCFACRSIDGAALRLRGPHNISPRRRSVLRSPVTPLAASWSDPLAVDVTTVVGWSDPLATDVTTVASWSDPLAVDVATVAGWSDHLAVDVATVAGWSDHLARTPNLARG